MDQKEPEPENGAFYLMVGENAMNSDKELEFCHSFGTFMC